MRTVIGVMGGAVADDGTLRDARTIGRMIAERGHVLLNGGRDAGVMAASAAGAREAGGLVVGILPGFDTSGATPDLDIAIPTGMGDARNAINVLASALIVALPGGSGTISEVALALKSGKRVVTVGFPLASVFPEHYRLRQAFDTGDPQEAMTLVDGLLAGLSS